MTPCLWNSRAPHNMVLHHLTTRLQQPRGVNDAVSASPNKSQGPRKALVPRTEPRPYSDSASEMRRVAILD